MPHPLPPAEPELAPSAYADLNHQAELALSGVSGLAMHLGWPDVVVEESNVQVQVSALRKCLGPAVVATVQGSGDCSIAPVEGVAPDRRHRPGSRRAARTDSPNHSRTPGFR